LWRAEPFEERRTLVHHHLCRICDLVADAHGRVRLDDPRRREQLHAHERRHSFVDIV
jgi:hypothetical protein